jgi:hypothetical protein
MVWDADNKLLLAIVAGAFAIVGTLVTAIVSISNSIESTNTALELNTSDRKTFATARARFLELYVGELAVVEQATSDIGNESVEAKMVQFRHALDDGPQPDSLPRSDLEGASLNLAKAVRGQTASSWDVTLGPLGHKEIADTDRRRSLASQP